MKCLDATPPEIFPQARKHDDRITTAEDATLSFLFQFNGWDTGGWGDFTRSHDKNKEQYAFVHGDKRHYGQPIPPHLMEPGLPVRAETAGPAAKPG